jgi:hypothetical protein
MGIDAYAGNPMRVETAYIAGRFVKAHQRVDLRDSGKPPVDGAMGGIIVETEDTDFNQRAEQRFGARDFQQGILIIWFCLVAPWHGSLDPIGMLLCQPGGVRVITGRSPLE